MLSRVARAARRTERRMRAAAGLEALTTMVAVSLVALALALTLWKVVPGFPARWVRDVALGSLVAILLSTLRAATRRLPKFAGALRLDAYHGLADRMTNALSFAALPAAKRTALMDIAID